MYLDNQKTIVMKEIYLLIYLNEMSYLHKGSGWKVSTIFEHFPSVDEILDHSCLRSSDSNDVTMAKKLVESNGEPFRFTYDGYDPTDYFFECRIVMCGFGEKLELWNYLITGYADCYEGGSHYIPYKKNDKNK